MKLNFIVKPPKELEDKEDSKQLSDVEWPALPLKGHFIDLAPQGYVGGVGARVIDVQHWLGCGDIDIICTIEAKQEAASLFHSLKKEDGWKD
ncbi:MAG: hypothetical protein KGI70_00085 [Patescibacteria group bacterium]|nr:hypothetical protein [Patescibacteria group bacterium]